MQGARALYDTIMFLLSFLRFQEYLDPYAYLDPYEGT